MYEDIILWQYSTLSFNCITMYVCTEVPLINTQIVLQIFKQNMCTVYLCMHAFVCGYMRIYVCIMYVCMYKFVLTEWESHVIVLLHMYG